jgi:hypothetical protein
VTCIFSPDYVAVGVEVVVVDETEDDVTVNVTPM